MLENKNILFLAIVLVLMGTGLYLAFISQETYFPEEAAEPEMPEPISYEIASAGTWQEEIKRARYHIVAEDLLLEEEQIRALAGRIIEDILLEDSNLSEIELFLYNESGQHCQAEAAEAYFKWAGKEIYLKIREGEIDSINQPEWWKE